MKVNSKIFKGIEYIQVTDLPEAQQAKLLETINHELLIKIMIEKKIISNCLQYKDYVSWYENLYKGETTQAKSKTVDLTNISVALNKA